MTAGAARRARLSDLTLSAALLVLVLLGWDILHLLWARPAELSAGNTALALSLAFVLIAGTVVILTLAEAAAALGFVWAERLTRPFAGRAGAPVLAALLASPILMLMARQPFLGNRYRDTPAAVYGPWLIFAALLVLAVCGVWCLARLLRALLSEEPARPWLRAVVLVALAGTFAGVALVDARWQVGWYPVVHGGLSTLAAVVAHLLLVTLVVQHTAVRAIAYRTFVILVPLALVVAPFVLRGERGVAWWRIASGSQFAARSADPLLRLAASRPRPLVELTRLPDAGLDALIPVPSVAGVPPALATSGVLISVDTLRSDMVGAQRSGTSLTPRIDAFFAEGQIFSRAYSQYASTRHSVRAIVESRIRDRSSEAGDDLINRLRDYGFQVIGVLPEDMRTFVNVERYNFTKLAFYDDPASLIDSVRAMTQGTAADKRFVWVHMYQPHDPYVPPPHLAAGTSARERYEAEVRWVDADFDIIASELSAGDDSIVVFAADHGEEFREHGGTLHGRTPYDETIRVPLAIRAPGIAAGIRDELVANADIAPTILSALGIPVPDTYEGFDLLERASAAPPDRIVYAESVTNAVVAIQGRHKWVHWPDLDLWEAYDLERDPRELRNLADRSDVMASGRDIITRFRLLSDLMPRLERVERSDYAGWLSTACGSGPPPGDLALWVGFRLGRRFVDDTRIRAMLQDCLTAADHPALKATLVETLEDAFHTAAPGEWPFLPGPQEAARRMASTSGALDHPLAAVRKLTGEMLARERPEEAARQIHATSDPALARGLLEGLGQRVEDVEQGFFRAFLEHPDVEVRVAAVKGLQKQEGQRSLTVLKQRHARETSPTVSKALVDALFAVDRAAGVAAVRDEIEVHRLSDYVRARTIEAWRVEEAAQHLADLFASSRSGPFRDYLLTVAMRLGQSTPAIQAVVRSMGDHAHEPEIRRRIRASLASLGSDSYDQDDESPVPREP